MKYLVLFDSREGQTRSIARRLAGCFTQDGHDATVLEISLLAKGWPVPPHDFVVVGASIHQAHYSEALKKFLRQHEELLQAERSAFFSVSLSEAGSPEKKSEARRYIDSLLKEIGWTPCAVISLAGALRYRDYGFLKRWMLKKVMEESGGETDTSRNHEYTDWQQVETFARKCEQLAA
ncbi:MAG: menaquinone-dependent protoporphyrinogen IX dehydrogenase [Candidatus Hydrogenedentes bacterium]|nr:menaquinone-dependent protoporphyrinogen IX dehydrogenase [Candidatus Hydrogenedentota bacterium]